MELNQFRDVDIVLDKANDNIIQKQFVSAGDKDGRSLTAQLTDNGVIGEIIGAAMNLYWHNQASGLTDLSAFYVVDRATSVFKIDYPQNMLTPGKVIAYIQIIHGGKVTHTKPFEITVQNLAGTTRGVLATAEYSALITTLAKANEFETQLALTDGRLDTIIVDGTPTEGNTMVIDGAVSASGVNHGTLGTNIRKTQTGEAILPKAIVPALTSFLRTGKNLFDKAKATAGGYINWGTGGVTPAEGFLYGEYMPISPNTTYTRKGTYTYAWYDKNKKFISGGNSDKTITSPANAVYLRISTYHIDYLGVTGIDGEQVELGSASTAYEPFEYRIDKLNIEYSSVKNIGLTVPDVNLPPKIYTTVGKETRLRFANLIKENPQDYQFDVTSSLGKQMTEEWIGTPSTATTTPLTLQVYERGKLVGEKATTVVSSNPRTTPLKILVMGDSTVYTDNYGYVTKRIQENLLTNVELIGTMGSGTNKFEGRGGWTAAKYRTGDSHNGTANPFYNPAKSDFDFTHYMSVNGFADVDVVIINLGINDTFAYTSDASLTTAMNTIKGHFDHIIASIRTFDSNINVALNITIPPNDSQDTFGNGYGNNQNQWRYKYNNSLWVKEMIQYYSGSVDLIPIHAVVNTKTDINDAVHPKEAGYYKIGDMAINYLNSL